MSDADNIPQVKDFEGIGELTVGGNVAAGDLNRLVFTALALLNDPAINDYLLANKVNMTDRMTKTKIFPRQGMKLPNGETFTEPQPETVALSDKQENE